MCRGDRGHPQAADRVLDPRQGRHGRAHSERRACARRRRRSSSSCSSTTRSTAPSATRAASARCRTSPSAGAAGARASSSPSATSSSRCRSHRFVAIDRERCILCYRCVRFSQEVSEDYQLVLQERGALLRRDVRRPLRGAVQRQHRRAVPRGRADLPALPLPRAPVGHRGLGPGVHAVPVAVQRQLHRARRARPARPGARPPRGRRRLAVRQGPLRLPVRSRRRAHHQPASCATAATCAR